jgi:hypothetical protein
MVREYQLHLSVADSDDPALELYRLLQQAAKRVLMLDVGADRSREWYDLVRNDNGDFVGSESFRAKVSP